jgi:glycerate-2-kinase
MGGIDQGLDLKAPGGLLRATRAGAIVGLLLSDVIGDDPAVIGSGPTVPSPTTAPDARVTNVVIGSNLDAVDGAAREAQRLGLRVLNLGCDVTIDPETVARRLADLLRSVRDDGVPVAPPVCIVQGGEAPVRLPSDHGRGGRNQHLALLVLRELGDFTRAAVVCGGTDGEDGPTDAAGGVVDADVAAAAHGLDVADAIRRCDAYTFHDTCGALLRTGRTGTNVADLRVAVVQRPTTPEDSP